MNLLIFSNFSYIIHTLWIIFPVPLFPEINFIVFYNSFTYKFHLFNYINIIKPILNAYTMGWLSSTTILFIIYIWFGSGFIFLPQGSLYDQYLFSAFWTLNTLKTFLEMFLSFEFKSYVTSLLFFCLMFYDSVSKFFGLVVSSFLYIF